MRKLLLLSALILVPGIAKTEGIVSIGRNIVETTTPVPDKMAPIEELNRPIEDIRVTTKEAIIPDVIGNEQTLPEDNMPTTNEMTQ